jgi:hypothetical protein
MDMPKQRYKMWEEPARYPLPDEVIHCLKPLILGTALIEDFTGPKIFNVDRDEYLKHLEDWMRLIIDKLLKDAGITLPPDRLPSLYQGTAGEIFVIRGLKEAERAGEFTMKQIRALDLYKKYSDYFDRSDQFWAQELQRVTAGFFDQGPGLPEN